MINRRKALPDPVRDQQAAIACGACHYQELYHGRSWCVLHGQSTAFARDDEALCGNDGRSFIKRNVA